MEPANGMFGFLPIEKNIRFWGGSIRVLDGYKENAIVVRAMTNADGFIYPPIQATMKATEEIIGGNIAPEEQWDWKEVPQSQRPALLHSLPASHEIVLDDELKQDEFRRRDGAFLMYLIGYLYGYRLQFSSWWFDGRISLKNTHNIYVSDDAASQFISKSYRAWKQWPQDIQRRFTNLLYMNSRLESYEWDWERFTIAYMVFDGCYKHAKTMAHVQDCSHSRRLQEMAKVCGLYFDRSVSNRIVNLRNDLFHEALWDGGQPCSGGGQDSFSLTEFLRGINNRLIPALLGYPTDYIKSRWDRLGTCEF